MDTLSLVSKYLNGMEDILDDGDSMEARKLTVEKSKEELELFEALNHKSVIVKEGSHKVVVFKKAPPHAYSRPFTRFSLPCDVDGQCAWDAELDIENSFNYITEERFDQLGFVRVDYEKYGRKMVRDVRVEIHSFMFLVDFVVIGYANEGEPSVLFGRDFLVTSNSRVDFGIGKMRIDLTMLEEMKEIDAMLDALVENLEEVGSSNGDLVKMGKASRNKNHKVNKLTPPPQIKIEEIPTIYTIAPPSPIYHPLTQKQKEKVKEVLDRKYKELEESKPILEVLEKYMTYRKKLDEVLMGRARLNSDDYGEEVKMRIVKHRLPKKMYDLGNFVLPVKVNRIIEMNALANTGASVSVLPYYLFMNLGLGDPKPYNSNLTMADNTQAKAMGKVKNVRI
ncbi:zinc finger, CCHC-type containing protein [Tanacetum coccineum]